jgi:hypothetical protein
MTKEELPATQLHHWVFMKQTYKNKLLGPNGQLLLQG